jgi:hypothetical protein
MPQDSPDKTASTGLRVHADTVGIVNFLNNVPNPYSVRNVAFRQVHYVERDHVLLDSIENDMTRPPVDKGKAALLGLILIFCLTCWAVVIIAALYLGGYDL